MRNHTTKVALVAILLATPVFSTVYYVSPTGKDTATYGTSVHPWATPRYACDFL